MMAGLKKPCSCLWEELDDDYLVPISEGQAYDYLVPVSESKDDDNLVPVSSEVWVNDNHAPVSENVGLIPNYLVPVSERIGLMTSWKQTLKLKNTNQYLLAFLFLTQI